MSTTKEQVKTFLDIELSELQKFVDRIDMQALDKAKRSDLKCGERKKTACM